jgi:hypothetical protein
VESLHSGYFIVSPRDRVAGRVEAGREDAEVGAAQSRVCLAGRAEVGFDAEV